MQIPTKFGCTINYDMMVGNEMWIVSSSDGFLLEVIRPPAQNKINSAETIRWFLGGAQKILYPHIISTECSSSSYSDLVSNWIRSGFLFRMSKFDQPGFLFLIYFFGVPINFLDIDTQTQKSQKNANSDHDQKSDFFWVLTTWLKISKKVEFRISSNFDGFDMISTQSDPDDVFDQFGQVLKKWSKNAIFWVG